MHRKALTFAVCLLAAASVRDASAQVGQPWTDRGYFNFNIGFESASGTLADARTFRLPGDVSQETGTIGVLTGVDSGALVDFSGGWRVWQKSSGWRVLQNVSVGIGFHTGSTSGEGTVQASVPNPFFTDRPRSVALAISELDRTERAVHLLFGYMIPVNEEVSVHVSLGPSFYRLKQEVVSDVTFTEQGFPFTAVTATPIISERTDSATGFNIGVDAAYKLYETPTFKLGGGVFLRYAGASAKITILNNVIDSDVGGVQIGFGARLRF